MALCAAIFDVDGTLAETEEAHRRAFNAAFRDLGVEWEWDRRLYRDLLAVTGGKERIRHYVTRFHPDDFRKRELDRLVPELHCRKTRHYCAAAASRQISLRPGVRRLIEQCRAERLRLAIATTSSAPNVQALLRSTLGCDGDDVFEVTVTGDAVGAKKPAPDAYLEVLRALRLRPETCIAIEDSFNGLQASRAAGVATIVTVSAYTTGESFDGALSVLSDLGEPDRPFELISGECFGRSFVDTDLLGRWHDVAAAPRPQSANRAARGAGQRPGDRQ